MGLFSSLLGSNKVAINDKVWKTRDWAIKGMATEALKAITQGEIPLVICFFPEALQHVIDFFNATQVPYVKIETGLPLDFSGSRAVYVADASVINADGGRILPDRAKSSKLLILFAGHYPLPKTENALIAKLTTGLHPPPRVAFCLSLEDPFMQAFGSDQLKPLLETLGFKDDECIEHSMVSKSIRRAQEKLEKAVQHEKPAASEAEWFEKNYRKE